jgi:hypothetical protein
MEQVLGEHLEPESSYFGESHRKMIVLPKRFTLAKQNRAYAVSQLSDLHQKLSRAQSTVHSTRATPPTLKGEKDKEAKLGVKSMVCKNAQDAVQFNQYFRRTRKRRKKLNWPRASKTGEGMFS